MSDEEKQTETTSDAEGQGREEIRKTVIRPTQDETSYTTVSLAAGQQCANCRWFDARGEYGPYCALIDNYPLDILATGRCERWELSPLEADIDALEPDPLPVVIVDEAERAASDDEHKTVEEDIKYIAPDSNADGFLKQLRGKLKRGLKPGTSVLKDASGRRYMLVVTSNSYLDREGETIKTEALKSWVDSQWLADDYFHTNNKLLFWHDERVELGDIVWADMRGPFLIELARENDTPLARKMFNYREAVPNDKWGASHKFAFLTSQRDDEGTYHKRIYKRETSILPRDVAANAFTLSGVIPMASKRDEYLNKMLGLENAASLLDEGLDKLVDALTAQGIEHKAQGEADPQETATEAVADATKKFGHLVVQMVDDVGALLERQDELDSANKALTEENAALNTDTAEQLKALNETVEQLQTQLDARPRSASRAKETEIDKDKLPEGAQKAIEDSLTEYDDFLGATVKKEL